MLNKHYSVTFYEPRLTFWDCCYQWCGHSETVGLRGQDRSETK